MSHQSGKEGDRHVSPRKIRMCQCCPNQFEGEGGAVPDELPRRQRTLCDLGVFIIKNLVRVGDAAVPCKQEKENAW